MIRRLLRLFFRAKPPTLADQMIGDLVRWQGLGTNEARLISSVELARTMREIKEDSVRVRA